VQRVGHAVVQRIEILAKVRGQGELGTNHVQHILLALGIAQVGIQEMVAQLLRGLLQIAHAVGANRLHDVRANAFERRVLLCSLHGFHLCGLPENQSLVLLGTITRKLA